MKRTHGSRLLPDPSFADITDREMLHHGIAYVAQTSWLLNATIRDNILFGEPYDEDRYMRTLRACALIRDLETLEGGDMTEIGEKGVNLSGGQKQRISLARATYSRAAYVLLDDPLSAVDAPTARHLFEECILSLLKNRTVLLVSHSASLVVPRSAFVVAMKNGLVVASGSPQALMARTDISDIVAADLEGTPTATTPRLSQPTVDGASKVTGEKTNIVDKEGRATGSVHFSTYVTYLKACGGWLFIFWIALAFVITTAADFLSSWWIQQWTDSLNSDADGSHDKPANSPLYYITIFGLISLVELVALMFRFVIQFYGGWHASKMLHHKLLDAILGAPLRFFEVTPVGRLINRFSKDLSDIDSGVMFTVVRFGTLIVAAISNLIVVTYVAPVFLGAIVFQIFYQRIASRYLASSRELKRIESVSSSPIYAQFSETLNGLETIRAYNSQKRVIEDIQHKVDANHRAFFYLFAANRWLYFRNAILSGTIVFMAGFSIIFSGVTAGWAGLAFTFASQLTSKMSAMVQTHASLEMSMNSVERVEEYSRTDQEPPAIVEDNRPPENWPQHGAIEFKDLSIRYDKDLPLVLKNISFSVNPKEKIGIVGRTGAGKSTVSLALFRILPFANGTIEIDGVDINQIGLRDLRSKLTVIAQDATLFEGTDIRFISLSLKY
jgi:ABC-type multidrug transport system fused ATPase/permease subunit